MYVYRYQFCFIYFHIIIKMIIHIKQNRQDVYICIYFLPKV